MVMARSRESWDSSVRCPTPTETESVEVIGRAGLESASKTVENHVAALRKLAVADPGLCMGCWPGAREGQPMAVGTLCSVVPSRLPQRCQLAA